MLTPYDIWAPMFRAPFSGDVTQEITPRFFSPDIKGSPVIEARVQTEVASFGTQLGMILDALQTLSAATGTPLPVIDKLVADVEEVKLDVKEGLREEAEAALERLRKVDEAAYRSLVPGKY